MEKTKNNLIERHFNFLRECSLTEETIQASGIRSITVRQLEKKLGYAIPEEIESACEIPYPLTNYSRYLAFHPEEMELDPWCFQDFRIPARFYIPEESRFYFDIVEIPLIICGTEILVLNLCQDGHCSIGFPRLWASTERCTVTVNAFNGIALKGREVIVMPDRDLGEPERENDSAECRLAIAHHLVRWLREQGAYADFLSSIAQAENKVVALLSQSENLKGEA